MVRSTSFKPFHHMCWYRCTYSTTCVGIGVPIPTVIYQEIIPFTIFPITNLLDNSIVLIYVIIFVNIVVQSVSI